MEKIVNLISLSPSCASLEGNDSFSAPFAHLEDDNGGLVLPSCPNPAVGAVGVFHDRTRVIDDSLEECKAAISHTKESKASVSINGALLPDRVLNLFKRMIDEDCEMLYLSDRPEKLIVTNIAVPPIAIRPSVFVDGGTQSNENDITERLKRIIQANASLHQELSETSTAGKNLAGWLDLQMEVALYINSDVRGAPQHMQTARPLSGFIQRLKGKQGRFRGNLSGKRVEFTGRTVISPDPNLKITEVWHLTKV
ncbi:hypothetical protein LguiA_029636 [Lonicera macranthoides]